MIDCVSKGWIGFGGAGGGVDGLVRAETPCIVTFRAAEAASSLE
jgi:hypothetical protein